MPRIPLRRKSSAAVVATLLISGALLATGTAPAHASNAVRSIDIQTHQKGASSDVHSVLVTDGGSAAICVPLVVDSPIVVSGGWFKPSRLLNGYVVNRVLVELGQSWDVYSYGDVKCTDSRYFIGSKGKIDPSKSARWSVYDARPPRAAL